MTKIDLEKIEFLSSLLKQKKINKEDFLYELEELLSIDDINVIEEEESLIIETPLYKVLIGKLKTEIRS
jgi:hypothetical protein